MLITDDDPNEELFDVVRKNNRIDNTTINKPVRIFTYMMGRDITTTPGLERLACENRGLCQHYIVNLILITLITYNRVVFIQNAYNA